MIFFYKNLIKSNQKKSNKKVLPVNCNCMIDCWCMTIDLWTVIIYKLKGYKVHGQPRTGSGVSLRILFPPKREWLCKQVESGNTTAKKASIFSHNWLVRYSEANAEPTNASFTWTLFPCYAMWYMLYALWMCVCVCTFTARVLSLQAWHWALSWLVGAPVMSRRAQCGNEKATVLPCSWASVCVCRLSFVNALLVFL